MERYRYTYRDARSWCRRQPRRHTNHAGTQAARPKGGGPTAARRNPNILNPTESISTRRPPVRKLILTLMLAGGLLAGTAMPVLATHEHTLTTPGTTVEDIAQ